MEPKFERLSDVVRRFWKIAHAKVPAGLPLREGAAATALLAVGEQVAGVPALVNVGGIAYAARERLVVHEVRPAVIKLVDATDLHSLPQEAPRLVRGSWIVEVRDPSREALFDDVVSLGGYAIDGDIFVVGLTYPDGARVAKWQPEWAGGEVEVGTTQALAPLGGDKAALEAWARQAARFVVVFGMLLEAENAPVRIRETSEGPARPARSRTHTDWVTRHVTLTQPAAAADPAHRHTPASSPTDDRSTNAVASAVQVTGHLKHQRYGPGNSKTKLVYVESYSARRWVSPTSRTVVH